MADEIVSLQSAFELYEKVCENHDIYVGKTISTRERDAKGLTASTLVYGEIMFEPFNSYTNEELIDGCLRLFPDSDVSVEEKPNDIQCSVRILISWK